MEEEIKRTEHKFVRIAPGIWQCTLCKEIKIQRLGRREFVYVDPEDCNALKKPQFNKYCKMK